MSQKKKGLDKLGSNIIVFTIGSFASKFLNFILLPLYTAVLTKQEYGIYDIIVTSVNLVYPIVTLLIAEATMRFALDETNDKKKVFTLSAIIVSISALVVAAASPLLLLSETYKKYCAFFVLYYIVTTVHTFVAQFVKGIERTKVLAVGGIISTFSIASLNILLLVVFKFALTGFFIATISGLLVSTIYMWVCCRLGRFFCKVSREDKGLLLQMLRYSIPIMPNSISWWLSTSSSKYIINYCLGVAMSGLYSVAYKIPSLMTVFTNVFLSAWTISAVEDFGTEKSKQMYTKVYDWFFTFVIGMSAIVIAGTKIISGILFSADFFQAWIYVPMLVVAYVFHDLSSFLGSVYTASKSTKMLFVSTLIGAIVNVIINIILIPVHGAIGAAFATLLSYFIILVIRFFDTRRFIEIRYNYFIDIISMLLVVFEMVIVSLDVKYAFTISVGVVLCLAILRFKSVFELICLIFENIKKKKVK